MSKRLLEERLTQWLLRQFCRSAGLLSMTAQLIAPRKSLRVTRSVIRDRKSTRLNSSHRCISYAVFCLKKKTVSERARTSSDARRSRDDTKNTKSTKETKDTEPTRAFLCVLCILCVLRVYSAECVSNWI